MRRFGIRAGRRGIGGGGAVEASAVPTDLGADLVAWYHAADANLTVVSAAFPATLGAAPWAVSGVTVTTGQPGPTGNDAAYVRDVVGQTYRRMYLALRAEGILGRPFEIRGNYRIAGNGKLVLFINVNQDEHIILGDGTHTHSYSNYFPEDSWVYTGAADGNGWRPLRFRFNGEITDAQFTTLTLAAAEWATLPAAAVSTSDGYDLADLEIIQRYPTAWADSGPNGADVTAVAATAPNYHAPADPNGYVASAANIWWPYTGQKYFSGDNASVCAALSGTQPCTVIVHCRRIPMTVENTVSWLLKATASSGNNFQLGWTNGNETADTIKTYAGLPGVTGPQSTICPDCENNFLIFRTSEDGTTGRLDIGDTYGLTEFAAATALSRGTMTSYQIGVAAGAVTDYVIVDRVLSNAEVLEQIRGMTALLGGQAALDTFVLCDGTTIKTKSKRMPLPWVDDVPFLSAPAAAGAPLLMIGGDIHGSTGRDKVYRSPDLGVNWAEIVQTVPIPETCAGCGFPYRYGGVDYIYVACTDVRVGGKSNGLWRCRADSDQKSWTEVGAGADWTGFKQGSFMVPDPDGGPIYHVGGQSDLLDYTTATNRQFKSEDGGDTWTEMAAAPWTARMAMGAWLPLFAGKVQMGNGARYSGSGAFHDVYTDWWSFDPTSETWTQEMAQVPWPNGAYGSGAWLDYIPCGTELNVTGGLQQRKIWRTVGADVTKWIQLWPIPLNTAHAEQAAVTGSGATTKSYTVMADNRVCREWSRP